MNTKAKKSLVIVAVLAYHIAPVLAADRTSLYGEWGTDTQCSRALITPKGTKLAAPFDIRPDWLGHGDVWCRLNWGTESSNDDGLFAVAQAICGEDNVRSYTLDFRLSGDELTLTWDRWHKTGPVTRCE